MTTRNSLSYRDLAKAESVVKRVVQPDDLVRLSQETVAVGTTHAEFQFGYTDNGRPYVITNLVSEASIACQWCLEPKAIELGSSFRAMLAQDENEASTWSALEAGEAGDEDKAWEVIVAGVEFDAVRLIEDELLLSLPNQVCVDAKCPNRPEREFGDENTSAEATKEDNPFAVLATLKK